MADYEVVPYLKGKSEVWAHFGTKKTKVFYEKRQPGRGTGVQMFKRENGRERKIREKEKGRNKKENVKLFETKEP